MMEIILLMQDGASQSQMTRTMAEPQMAYSVRKSSMPRYRQDTHTVKVMQHPPPWLRQTVLGPDVPTLVRQALARDPRRAAVEQALLARLWPRAGFTAAEKPRLLSLLATPEYQGLLQVGALL